MLSPALLVVFVMSAARVESTRPFEQAAHEVLGPSAALRVEEVASLPSDAVALERAGSADGVVKLSWNAARQTAVLHCYIANEQRWVDRTIHFGAADREPDRGRLLGFAVAAMFIDAPGFARARAQEQAVVEPRAVAPSAPVPTSPLAAARAVAAANDAQQRASVDELPSGLLPSRVHAGAARSLPVSPPAGSARRAPWSSGLSPRSVFHFRNHFQSRIQLEGREREIG